MSSLNVDGVCKLFEKLDDVSPESLQQYKTVVKQNNINGKVLLHCDIDDLKKLLQMNFGDWEMYKVMIVSLREHEMTSVTRQDEAKYQKKPERRGNLFYINI